VRLLTGLIRQEHTFALVIGFTDGILTALTLAAGRVVSAPAPIDVSLALRISAAASLSGMFIFFTAEYARLRAELVRAERQLNLTAHGRFAATQLGKAVFRDTLWAAAISNVCSFLGALFPLLSGILLPGPSWLAIIAAIVALGMLGAGIAQTVYGNLMRWAVALMVAGVVLSLVGMGLRIV
jgi:predicted membrane protein (TIGR00267 family)